MRDADRPESPRLTRRDVLVLGAGAFVVGVAPLVARRRLDVVRRSVPVMGTIAELAVAHRDPGQAQAAIDAAIEELRRVDRAMTRHVDRSEVGRVNLGAWARPVAVSEPTAAVIREALGWAEGSEGAFDPCVGRAIALWDVANRTAPPPPAAVQRLAGRRLYRALDLDRWRGQPVVRFADPDVALDLGGIAKGHGVDRAVEALRARGVGQAVVNVGGDLYALGAAATGAPWRVGIRSPEDPSRLAGELEISDAAVATSGDYLQYFSHGGERYHHLLDPRTAAPRRTPVRSVTVVAGTCLAADAAATAAFGLEPDRAARLLRARGQGAWIAHRITRPPHPA
jgi:thiamine biosynthesis lipoprotein